MIRRRDLFAGGAGVAFLGAAASVARAQTQTSSTTEASAANFGLVGDGVTDDTDAVQAVFDAAFNGADAALVTLPPGRYRVTRPITVTTAGRPDGNITHPSGLLAHGARILSEVTTAAPVVTIDIRATVRYSLIEGLQIQGSGTDGHGLYITCQTRGAYFYNFCLRDVIVESVGGDGLRLLGNVFEGQITNCYFRDNHRDGATFGHGANNTVLSAVHVFGCVFGGNGRNGASMIDGAADMSFYGCYFLLNQIFGLSVESGIKLLSHCGFENNHMKAESFATGDAGLRLLVGGMLQGCTAYSIYNQTHLVRAYVTNSLVMIGCDGDGGGDAAAARLAKIGGDGSNNIEIIGCRGGIDADSGAERVDMGGGVGARFGDKWDDDNLVWLGPYSLWVDASGTLRMKHGQPASDTDGKPVSS